MAKISKEEILNIARLANIDVHESEVGPLAQRLADVLSYAERVKEVAADAEEPSNMNVNVFREDVVVKTDPEPILSQAPEREDNFFVVPKIIENA